VGISALLWYDVFQFKLSIGQAANTQEHPRDFSGHAAMKAARNKSSLGTF